MSEAAFLALVRQPAILLDSNGNLHAANRGASTLIPGLTIGAALAAHTEDEGKALNTVLHRALRSSSTLPCSLTFTTQAGTSRLRGQCTRLENSDGDPRVGITFNKGEESRFQSLNQKIDELYQEINRRTRTQRDLETSLHRNQLLLRELQHRVKNNIQIQMSLLDQQADHADDESFSALTHQANQRLWALSQSLQVMYIDGDLNTVDATKLFASIAEYLDEAFGDDVTVGFSSSADWGVHIDRANSCALLLNELTTNALKHGLQGEPGRIDISLTDQNDKMILEVRDPGQGFDASQVRPGSFGLKLVKGLCRQIGAVFETDYRDGGICRLIVDKHPEG